MAFRRLLTGFVALLSSLGIAGCGSGAFASTYRVTVADPDGVLGPGTVQVSVFDVDGGNTRDWAGRSLGATAAESPYLKTIRTVETRRWFDDGPSTEVRAGLYLPGYRELGWYALNFRPENGKDGTIEARFVAWDGYEPQAKDVPPLTLTVRATAHGNAWDLAVTVQVRGPRPDEQQAAAGTNPLTELLVAAAAEGNQAEVERLLIKGAEKNGAAPDGRTALIAATYAGKVEVARYLVQYGADVNLKDRSGQSAFLIASSEVGPGDALLVVMLNGRARLDAADAAGDTALTRAARHAYLDIMRRLLTNGAAVNHVNTAGRTALHEVLATGKCTSDYLDAVKMLVLSGADVNLPDRESGRRPLDFASQPGCAEVAQFLAGAGARNAGR